MTADPTPADRSAARPALALLLLALSGAGHAIVPSTWKHWEDVDALTDKKTVSASGWQTGGVITVRCRDAGGANELSARVAGHSLLGASGEEKDVMWRFDRRPAVRAGGRVTATSRRAIVLDGRSGESFARGLAEAHRLSFRTWNHKGLELTSTFDGLRGAGAHVRKVLDACR